MFAAPAAIETRIFAELPQQLRIKDAANEITRHVGRSMDCFLEGPSFDRVGNLYCVDIPFGRIFRIDPHGKFEILVQYEGEPNGLKVHRDGRLFVADRRNGIVVIDPVTRQIDRPLQRYEIEPFRGPNDLVFSRSGDLYFTDQGMSDLLNPTGRVFCLRADGRVEVLLDRLPGPNGIAFDPSGRVLFVALTRTNSIMKVVLSPDGRPSRMQNFIQLSGGGGPDGIAVDTDGGLAIAQPFMGAVWLFDVKGQPTLRINCCRGTLGTNVAFGGTDGRQLYITESETGTIQVADMPVRGLPLFSHA